MRIIKKILMMMVLSIPVILTLLNTTNTIDLLQLLGSISFGLPQCVTIILAAIILFSGWVILTMGAVKVVVRFFPIFVISGMIYGCISLVIMIIRFFPVFL